MEGAQHADGILHKIDKQIQTAKALGAELIVFPELIALDAWPLKSEASESQIIEFIAEKITPALFAGIEKLSRQYGLAVLGGSAPRRVGKKIRNTAILSFPNGKNILHDKIFLTAWEKKMGWEPGNTVEVFNAPWGRTAILICYDLEFPAVASALVRAKPEVLLVPSMTESRSGLQRVRWAGQSRVVELHNFVVISGTVGEIGKDWLHYGQSAFLSPRDVLFPEPPVEGKLGFPGITMGRLDFARLRESRLKTEFFPARDEAGRKIEVRELR